MLENTACPDKVVIVLVNWNGSDDTIECIQSLWKSGARCRAVVVVDNGSHESDFLALRNALGDRVIIMRNERNLGFASACNKGILEGLRLGGEWLLLLNNDTVVTDGFLDELEKGLEVFPCAGVIGSRIMYDHDKTKIWSAGGKIAWWLHHFNIGMNQKVRAEYMVPKVVDFVSGACMLITKRTIEDVGELSSDFFMGWEDIDYCHRASMRGHESVYWPYSVIYHKVSSSYKRGKLDAMKVRLGARNAIVFRSKHFGNWHLFVYFLALVFVVAPAHVTYYSIMRLRFDLAAAYLKGVMLGIPELRRKGK